MPDDVRIDALIPAELDAKLDEIAKNRRRPKAALVREALAEFVLSDEEFIAAVEEGRAAARAADLIPHAQVVREIRAILPAKR
jgi:predicted transcriptional regulator